MRLPLYKPGAVQSLGRRTPGLEMAKYEAIGNAIEGMGKQVIAWYNADQATKASSAEAEYHKEMQQVEIDNKTKGSYEEKDLPPDYDSSKIERDKEGKIPAHLVKTDVLRHREQQIRERLGASISDEKVRAKWSQKVGKHALALEGNSKLSSINELNNHILQKSEDTLRSYQATATPETVGKNIYLSEQLIDQNVAKGVLSLADGEKRKREVRAGIDYSSNQNAIDQINKAVAEKKITAADGNRELEKVAERVDNSFMTYQQRNTIRDQVFKGQATYRALRKTDKVLTQDERETAYQIEIERGKPPSLDKILADQKAGLLRRENVRSIMANIESEQKERLEERKKSDPLVMQGLDDEINEAEFGDSTEPTSAKIAKLREILQNARGIGVDPGASQISASDYRIQLARINELAKKPRKTQQYKDTVSSMKRVILGVGSGEIQYIAEVKGKDRIKYDRAIGQLNKLLDKNAKMDVQQWWADNQGRYMGEAAKQAIREIVSPQVKALIVTEGKGELVYGGGGSVVARKGADPDFKINVEASLLKLDEAYRDGKFFDKLEYDTAVDILNDYSKKLQEDIEGSLQ